MKASVARAHFDHFSEINPMVGSDECDLALVGFHHPLFQIDDRADVDVFLRLEPDPNHGVE